MKSSVSARLTSPIGLLVVLLAVTAAGCTRSPAQKEAKYLTAGKDFYSKKDYTRAILQFKNAIKAVPRDPEPYYQIALAYLGAGDLRQAVLGLRKALELNPQYTAAQVKMAELLSSSRDPELLEEAERRLHEVLNGSPHNEEALKILALTEWGLGKRDDAEQHFMQALDRVPADFKAALGLVNLKLLSRDFKAAEELLKKFCAENPKLAEPVLALGELYVLIGRPADAEQQMRRASEMDPKNGMALMDLAGMQVRAGRMEEAERIYRQVSALPDPQFKPMHAIFLFQSGKVDAAIAEFDKLAKEDPSDRTARSRLIQAYYNVNRRPDAEKVLVVALRKNPKDNDALLQRSRLYLDDGKYAEALNDLGQVLRFQPDSAEAHYMRAKVYEKTGESLRQRQELNEAVRLAPDFVMGRLELAQGLLKGQDPKSALKVLDEAIPSQKDLLPMVLQRNWANLALADMGEYQRGVIQALGIARIPEALLQDAQLKFAQQNYPAARASLEEVLKQSPDDLRAMDLLVRSYLAQKQPLSAAIAKMREHADQHTGSAPARYFLGKLLMANGDQAGARQSFEAAKTADAHFVRADERLAQLDLAAGKLADARKRLTGLVSGKTDRETELSVQMQLLALEEQGENYPAAMQHCRRILELDQNNTKALNDLAFLLVDFANQPDEALKLAQRAKEITPNSPDVADTLGWVLYRKGLYTVALTHFEYAASGKGAIQKCHLALAYFKLGKQEEGQRALDLALKLDPSLVRTKVYQEAAAEAKKKRG